MTFSITFNSPLTSEDLTVLAALSGNSTTGSTTTTTTTTTVNYFPADPALAPFPSPENSQQVILNGVVSGEPYLKDTEGRIHSLVITNGVVSYDVNGEPLNLSGSSATAPSELIVRQGTVFMILSGSGIVQSLASNGSVYTTALPAAQLPGSTGSTGGGTFTVPDAPTPATIAPGSSGRIINCGSAHPALPTIATGIAAAQAGDTVQIDAGTYLEAPPAWTVPLHIIGTGVTINATGLDSTLARGKGALVPAADSIIDGIAITGAGLASTQADLTSAIRPDSGCGYLTLNNVNLFGNQCGLGQGGFVCYMTVNNSTLDSNGLPVTNAGNGFAHNIYVGSGKLTLTNTNSTNPVGGHAVKTRCQEFYMNNGTVNASGATPIDIPDGTGKPFTISGVTINKAAGDANEGVFDYCAESITNGTAGGTISAGGINALCTSPFILNNGGTIALTGVTFTGNPVSAQGTGSVTGLPA